jgi:hypothetical protein
MHFTLPLLIQIATLLSVAIGFLSLINTVKSYREQMNMQILMKYAERYEHILGQFPSDALAARFDNTILPVESPELKLCVLKYLNLCSEEYYLTNHKYLAKSLWLIWEGDLKRILASPLFQREWPSLRSEFVSHPDFLAYVERVQASCGAANL